MSEVNSIVAEARDRAGKGTARAVRRTGRVPGVVYGNKEAPALISVESKLLVRELNRGSFTSKLLDLDIAGTKVRVLPRDVQLHPVTDRPVHVDFLRIAANSRIRVMVPTAFIDEGLSPGIKRGGVLNIVRHEIEFYCRADSIPENITISLAGTDIGHSIHISHIKLPDGVRPVITDRDFTVATVAAPTVVAEVETKPAEAAAEGATAAAGEEKAEPAAEAKESKDSKDSKKP
ncbi:MAG TPA: 50S ribosomal protein L25/general stress protein Ctc [Candidatus Sulfotelmatobacter sp.]|nr:50S ribosomal protein L25/general stress protein Ctc [Candidatus Sulfotelmatobacter sp.]